MKLADKLRGEINMGCQLVNNGAESSDELSKDDKLREYELSGSDCNGMCRQEYITPTFPSLPCRY